MPKIGIDFKKSKFWHRIIGDKTYQNSKSSFNLSFNSIMFYIFVKPYGMKQM